MIKSMTGFGKASLDSGEKVIVVEIRSLNSKAADISLRLPSALRNYELEVRNELSRQLERGKIDLSISIDSKKAEAPAEINLALAKTYYEQLKKLGAELNEPVEDALAQVLKFPDVMKAERKEADEKEWADIKKTIALAVAQLNLFREAEGKSLQSDFDTRLNNIANCLEEIKKFDERRVATVRERILAHLNEWGAKDKVDMNRFEQELIYYLEKLDINEEKVRLSTHLNYFQDTCKEAAPGRKLGFITQEIGREINTIGSKANDAQIQKLVVQMKDELEKMKEQVNNVL